MKVRVTRRTLLTGITATAIVPFTGAFAPDGARAQAAPETPYLVSADWLAEQLDGENPDLLVLDVSDLRPYRSRHVPGAVHAYWLETVEREYDYFGTVLNHKSVDNPEIEDQGKRLAWMRRYGISPDRHVVAYDRGDGRRAARIVWFLRFLGHERASLLDQGFDGWIERSLPTRDGEESPPSMSAEPVVTPADGFYIATDRLAELIETDAITLIDIRTDEERRDTVDGQFRTGVIPDSVHIPWDDPAFALAAWPAAFDPAAARQRLQDFGVTPDQRVVLYGRFGSDADQMWLALKASDFPQVEIYDRGWVEWSESGRLSLPIP